MLQFLAYAFLTIAGIQIFYYLFFFSRLAFYKQKPMEEETPLPPLSVVICAKDEQRNLSQNLPVILEQQYCDHQNKNNYEIIVVNDNSEDETLPYLQNIHGYPHFRYINISQDAKCIAGKKYALTMGIKGAANDAIVLTDADCKPPGTGWLCQMGKGFRPGKEIVLGYGAYERQPGLLNKVIRFETFFSGLQYLSFALSGIPYMGVGRNLAYKRELFFKHKGFLTHVHIPSGDDDLFINAAANLKNTAVVIHEDAITYSRPKQRWADWYRQKRRHLSTGKYYKFKHRFLLGLFSASLFLYYPFFVAALFFKPLLYTILIVFGAKLIIQSVIWAKSLRKLHEKDLFWYCLPFEILMSIYYLIFVPAVIFKPKKRWN